MILRTEEHGYKIVAITCLAFLAVAFMCTPTHAVDQRFGPWLFDLSLELTAKYDDNIDLQPDTPDDPVKDDVVFHISPAIHFGYEERQTSMRLIYTNNISLYDEYNENNSEGDDHRVGLEVSHTFGRHVTLEAKNLFISTSDPARRSLAEVIHDAGVIPPRTDTLTNYTDLLFHWNISQMRTIRFGAGADISRYDQPEDPDSISRVDQNVYSVTMGWEERITRRNAFVVDVKGAWFELDPSGDLPGTVRSYELAIGDRISLPAEMSLLLMAGGAYSEGEITITEEFFFKDGTGTLILTDKEKEEKIDDWTYSLRASLTKELEPLVFFIDGFKSIIGTGLHVPFDNMGVKGGIKWKILSSLNAFAAAGYTRSESISGETEFDQVVTDVGIAWAFSPWLSATAGYTFIHQDSRETNDFDMDNHRASLGLSLSLPDLK
ncbi:hypothetical protein ACFL4G_02630 [Thermodesulfobacteriota bacterium]